MIERMKKLTLLAVASERKALLKDLMLLGCVELKEQAATDEATPALREMGQTGLATEKARHAAITNALKLLDKYAPAKKSFLAPLPGAGACLMWPDDSAGGAGCRYRNAAVLR